MKDTEDRCHCGAIRDDQTDHCPCCGCEHHERICTERCRNRQTRDIAAHADTCWA